MVKMFSFSCVNEMHLNALSLVFLIINIHKLQKDLIKIYIYIFRAY